MAASDQWNPWHGCRRISAGCAHCYVFRIDEEYGRDTSKIEKTKSFDLPVRKDRRGEYKLHTAGCVYTCFSSDFFVEEADVWRPEAWRMIGERKDLNFFIITKRIHRFMECLPPDWGGGYDNVTICSTVEDQAMADRRLPIFASCPIQHKQIICEPLLGRIDLSPYLKGIEGLTVGGESGSGARPCHYEWVADLHDQCLRADPKVSFRFKQTGAKFVKDGKTEYIPRSRQFSEAGKYQMDIE